MHVRRLREELVFLQCGVEPISSSSSSIFRNRFLIKNCENCQERLGCIFNRGSECRSCKLRVCNSCRVYNFNSDIWRCKICHKQMEIQVATGDWMYEFVRRPSRRRDNRIYVPASDLIKTSIRRSWTISNPQSRPVVTSRLAPEMRAYNSLPRRRSDVTKEKPVPWSEILQQRRQMSGEQSTSTPSSSSSHSPEPTTQKKANNSNDDFDIEPISGAVFRKVTIKKKPREIENGECSSVGGSPAAYLLDYALDSGKIQPESDDYKLVFINSDSSSKGSNSDVEFMTEDCDWDYFDSTQVESHLQPSQQVSMENKKQTCLLGSGNFAENMSYDRSNPYLNRAEMDYFMDRYWSAIYGPRLNHPCENCGSAATLFQGLGSNFVPVPVPYPVPIPVAIPFGAEADLAYLDNAIRIKIRSFQPPFAFNFQSIYRNNSDGNSWLTERTEAERIQASQRTGSEQQVAASVNLTSNDNVIDKKSIGDENMVITQLPIITAQNNIENRNSSDSEQDSDDENFSQVFVVNPENSSDSDNAHCYIPTYSDVEDASDTVELKQIRVLDSEMDNVSPIINDNCIEAENSSDESCSSSSDSDTEEDEAKVEQIEIISSLISNSYQNKENNDNEPLKNAKIICEELVENNVTNIVRENEINGLDNCEDIKTEESTMATEEHTSATEESTSATEESTICRANDDDDETKQISSEDDNKGTESNGNKKIMNNSKISESDSDIDSEDSNDDGLNKGFKSYVMITQDQKNLSEVNVSVIDGGEVKINHTNSGDEINNSENESGGGLAGYFTLTLETGVESSGKSPKVKLNRSSSSESEDIITETDVQIVTGEVTMSQQIPAHDDDDEDGGEYLMCTKEEGIADDDSWVDETETGNVSESSSDETYIDREEELRGYHRAIDFTLHTILEESCEEDSDREPRITNKHTEIEKYFYGLAGVITQDEELSDTQSESSVVSDIVEEGECKPTATSSRLEKYFLTSFLEPSCASDNTDESGSVGSDSEGKPSPEQRRKKLVRARGAGRHCERAPDSVGPSDVSGTENNDDSTETDSYNDEPNFGIENAENMKRKKKKQTMRLIAATAPPQPIPENEVLAESGGSEPEDGAKTPQPDLPADPPPPTRKHHSRDSGFIGSCDDLLRPSGSSGSSNSGGSDREVDLAAAATVANSESTPRASPAPPILLTPATNTVMESIANNITKPSISPMSANLSRKDSFNNWSSDEETNLMMCKMRAFFKTMVAGGNKGATATHNTIIQKVSVSPETTKEEVNETVKIKPPQLVYFESELTRLMKTVPGIKDEQVREIVEYLSSEDTWSDSYDSSDYTSSDLEGAAFGPQTEIQQQISASCQEIIQKFDSSSLSETTDREDAFMYQRLVESLSRASDVPPPSSAVYNSPPLIAKVMHHIGSRLVALMHEVSAAGENSLLSGDSNQMNSPKSTRYRRVQRQQQSPTSSSIDDSDSAGGSDTEDGLISRMRRHPSLPRSKSHDLGQWQQLLQEAERRAVPRESLRSSSSGVSDLAEEREDYERFSWRGSFESALAADSRTKLSLEIKRRSTGSGSGSASDLFSSSDQLDRRGRVRSCGSIGSRASLPGRAGTRLSSSGGDLLTAAENEALLDSRRRGSVPDAAITPRSTTLPRSNPAVSASTNSLPRLPLSASPVVAAIHKSYSAQLHVTGSFQSSSHQYHHQYLQNVKSARYRAPNFRPPSLGPPKRAVSAPGLHQIKRTRLGSQNSGEEASAEENATVNIQSQKSSSNVSPSSTLMKEADDDIDRLVALHQQRSNLSSLGGRSESMASVYSGAGEGRYGRVAVRGQVEFGLQYDYKARALQINVKQARDLAAVDLKRNRSDPYVKVYLLPDKSKSGKRKTKVKKHTLNPVFEENLKFHISIDNLETRTLWLTVWHSDMFGRNDFLGEVMMTLENKVFDDPTPQWYTLQERTEPFDDLLSYKGDIIVALKFVPPDMSVGKKGKRSRGSLHVLIKEAKNLLAAKASGSSDPFCKSYLLPEKGRGSKQKTNVARRTCNPVWNHSFIYEDISLQDLSERSLELTVWDHDRLASNEFLGGLRFNLGSGKHLGKSVDWMDATGREISLWKDMLERPNLWVEGSLTLRASLDMRSTS